MKKLLLLIIWTGLCYQGRNAIAPLPLQAQFLPPHNTQKESQLSQTKNDQVLGEAFKQRRSNIQVQGSGVVIRLLADDLEGSRHQRFILRLNSRQTLLVAHNIDLAPRVNGLQVGDRVEFFGEYEWNEEGGVIHWTHDDPEGKHIAGWLKHRGRMYQ